MGLKVTDQSALLVFDRLLKLPEKLPQIANQVQAEAYGMALVAAQANIYSTQEGGYRRTREYLHSLDAKSQTRKNGIRITVSSDSEYAAAIEFGRDKLSPAMLQVMAAQGQINDPLTLGRSGVAWWRAGPVLTSAQVFAQRRMRELVLKEIRGR